MVVGQIVEFLGDVVVVVVSGIFNSIIGNEFVYGFSMSLQFYCFVFGVGDCYVDVVYFFIKICEGFVDVGLGFSCGVGSFDGFFFGVEGIYLSLEVL